MGRMLRVLSGLLLVVVTASGATAEMSHGKGPFRVEWATARPGVITGVIYNDYQNPATAIQLLVQALDPAGSVTSTQYLWVGGNIGALDGRSFRLWKLPPSQRYLVTVWSYQIIENPGCCVR